MDCAYPKGVGAAVDRWMDLCLRFVHEEGLFNTAALGGKERESLQ